jgi:hypothetical protein
MPAKRCPKCQLVNTATATTCDCGWSFEVGAMTDVRRYRPGDSPADRLRGWGLIGMVFAVGFIVMVVGRALGSAQGETGIIVASVGGLMMVAAAINAAVKFIRWLAR